MSVQKLTIISILCLNAYAATISESVATINPHAKIFQLRTFVKPEDRNDLGAKIQNWEFSISGAKCERYAVLSKPTGSGSNAGALLSYNKKNETVQSDLKETLFIEKPEKGKHRAVKFVCNNEVGTRKVHIGKLENMPTLLHDERDGHFYTGQFYACEQNSQVAVFYRDVTTQNLPLHCVNIALHSECAKNKILDLGGQVECCNSAVDGVCKVMIYGDAKEK